MVSQNALKIKSWADVFGLEKGSDHSGVGLPCSFIMTTYVV